MAARSQSVRPCSAGDARTRLRQAELYLQVAKMVLSEEEGEEATVATGNGVLAAIAAADSICCFAAGERFRGADHRQAADHLERVTGDTKLGDLLRECVDLKDSGHYGLKNVQLTRAKTAIRRAERLVNVAIERVR